MAEFTIIDGYWFKNGKNLSIKAEGKDGLPGKDGKPGLPGKDGKDGKPGKDGKDGLPGKDGKDGLPGKDGKDGKPGVPGKDGDCPEIKIGKVETSEDNKAKVSLKKVKGKNEYLLNLTLPRGPQGFMGFDAKINGKNTIEIKAGSNIDIKQEGKILTINSTSAEVDFDNYYNKQEIDKMIGDIESILNEVV